MGVRLKVCGDLCCAVYYRLECGAVLWCVVHRGDTVSYDVVWLWYSVVKCPLSATVACLKLLVVVQGVL